MKLYSAKNEEIACECECRHFTPTKINDTSLLTCNGCGKHQTYEQWQSSKKVNKHAQDLIGREQSLF